MRRRRLAVAAALMTLLASGCVEAPRSGVNVKGVNTDLVFGVPPTERAVPPAHTTLTPEDPVGVVKITVPTVTPRPAPQATPASDCREAGPADFPDQAAPTIATGQPAEGVYRWNVEGQQDVTGVGTVPLPEITRRSIRDVRVASDAWTYVQEEREVVFGSTTVVRTRFEVRTQEGSGRDPGIYLVRIERDSGGRTTTFAPQPPVLYLPMPAQIGAPPGALGTQPNEQIDAVGVDPTTLQALRHTGNVTKRLRVDACGDVIDTWYVDAIQEFVDPDGQTERRNYDYAFATQFGGLLVFEHVDVPCAQQDDDGACTPAPSFTMDASLGQIEPNPLPAEEQG